jgi:monoamine oxidase
VGRSEEQHFQRGRLRRRAVASKRDGSPSIAMTNATGIDAWGAWFDGVELLKASNLSTVNVKKAKNKNVAIVGAGMSGLMTYLCLTQAGMKNVQIIEAGNRLGGRVHTEYLSGGPFDYSYQEMGPMRFPTTITLANETYNISDHQMVFQLADELNRLNEFSKNLSVNFIPWYQSSPNGLYYHNGIRLPNGLPPTVAQVADNSSLKVQTVLDASTQELAEKVDEALPGQEFMVEMAKNMFKAHRDFLGKSSSQRVWLQHVASHERCAKYTVRRRCGWAPGRPMEVSVSAWPSCPL